ncbi:ATP11 protein-domain-containing protein [Infundibulicybe gibba]|nr:ATP11 protein-domain-containing protein [Infundibulicybe gibba]
MHRLLAQPVFRTRTTLIYSSALRCARINNVRYRQLHTADYESKYAAQLRRVAGEKGMSVEALKEKLAREKDEERRAMVQRIKLEEEKKEREKTQEQAGNQDNVHKKSPNAPITRKDSSPVKSLASILNMPRLLSTPHTSAQITALWTAYHTARSGGTGRGYICAAIPIEFAAHAPRGRVVGEGESDTAYEFYFMQWGFHDAPPVPRAVPEDPLAFITGKVGEGEGTNPQISTVLFTPLQEYKMRGTFATPYLVLTHYTDLVQTHGVVLLRGEITPASAAGGGGGSDGRYMLTQEDAQVLGMALQKYYLWGASSGKEGENEGERLLKVFHEKPKEFKWEELLEHASWGL